MSRRVWTAAGLARKRSPGATPEPSEPGEEETEGAERRGFTVAHRAPSDLVLHRAVDADVNLGGAGRVALERRRKQSRSVEEPDERARIGRLKRVLEQDRRGGI